MKFPPWRRREEELEEEIQSHLRMAIRDRMQRGESAEEAESAARREFGNVGLIKETTRAVWGLGRGNVLGPYDEVVGVAKDSKYRSLGEEQQSFFYVSAMQDYRQQMVLHVRTVGEPGLLRSALRDGVTANGGNRPADGARRRVARHLAAGDRAGSETDSDRRWYWRDTRTGAITLAVAPVDRRKRGGSGDVSHGSIPADSGRGVRLLDSWAARGEG